MKSLLQPWQLLILILAGWINRQEQDLSMADCARRNRALTQVVAHLQVSGHIDGSSIVADSIKRQ
jgi:hypothetical protein